MRRKKMNLSRRNFLRGAALGAASVSVVPILSRTTYGATQGTPGRFVVVINLFGGNDGLNTVVPAHLTPYVTRRQAINLVNNLPAGQTLHDLDGRYKLHYSLNNLKSIWDASQLHIVQKVSYPNPNQSHFTSQDIWAWGIRNNYSDGDGRGWLGRYADIYCPGDPLGVISVGFQKRHDFESNNTSPLILTSVARAPFSPVSTFKVDEDEEYPADHALRLQTVKDTLNTDPVPPLDPALSIFNANKQAHALVDQVASETAGWVDPGTYGTDSLGRYMRAISQLLHAHDTFKTKVFYTGHGGHDTHSGQHSETGTNRHQTLMQRLDAAIGAFKADMVARNKWNDCVIVVISEFGRRIFENGSVGTDHGHGNCILVCGGRVKGVATPGSGMTGDIVETELAAAAGQNPVTGNPRTLPFQYDFRDVYTELLEGHLGIGNVAQNIFPDPAFTPAPNDIDLV